jgi:competence protein ComEC
MGVDGEACPKPTATVDAPADRPDLRIAGPALAAWAASGVSLGLPLSWSLATAAAAGAGALLAMAGRRRWLASIVLVVAAAACVSALRVAGTGWGPVPELAADRAVASVHLRTTSDPRLVQGRFADLVVLEATLTRVEARGVTTSTRTPVVVFADPAWTSVDLGSTLHVVGRLAPSDSAESAAVLQVQRVVDEHADPAWWWRASERMRAAVRDGVAWAPGEAGALVPALVDGDDAGLSEATQQDFRTTGLTHLLAVSGTNLTLLVGFLLLVGRRVGVSAYGQVVVVVLAAAGFVLLARPEPSVLRAAAMGLVAVAGLGSGGRRRGVRALAWSVLLLVLVDPWLSRSVGFALSVSATAGILLLAPTWRDALARWMPPLLAEALAVPLAAQVVCTPLVAAISGQVSLVAVAANLAVAPAVGPTTVMGLLAGTAALLWMPLAHAVGWAAGACAWWIIQVAHVGAALPGAALTWGTTPMALVALTALCAGLLGSASWVLSRRWVVLAITMVVAAYVWRPVTPGWPPDGWLLVACDVGQGDGLVVDAGDGSALVIDTGPDPRLMDDCLDRLGVERVPLVVLTHGHADHVDGLPGVLADRSVGQVEVTLLDEPAAQVAEVRQVAADAGVPVRQVVPGERGSLGDLHWQVLSPPAGSAASLDPGSGPNDASIVLLLQARGLSVLFTGDLEPAGQSRLLSAAAADGISLDVDVLKVAHHGSAYQDPEFLAATDPQIAVFSVGADNDYGHPADSTLQALSQLGTQVHRTDIEGDVAVVVGPGGVAVTSR